MNTHEVDNIACQVPWIMVVIVDTIILTMFYLFIYIFFSSSRQGSFFLFWLLHDMVTHITYIQGSILEFGVSDDS